MAVIKKFTSHALCFVLSFAKLLKCLTVSTHMTLLQQSKAEAYLAKRVLYVTVSQRL